MSTEQIAAIRNAALEAGDSVTALCLDADINLGESVERQMTSDEWRDLSAEALRIWLASVRTLLLDAPASAVSWFAARGVCA